MKDFDQRRMSRREALYLIGGGATSLFLTACKVTNETSSPLASETGEVKRVSATPSVRASTKTATATDTPKPTATGTKEPTPTNTPEPVDILAKLKENGVEFPPETTTELETEDYKYTVSFSKGILERSGINYVHLAPEVMETMFLQSMGNFMYFSRDNYPEIYKDFFDPSILSIPDEQYSWSLAPVRELAEGVLKNGPVPVKFNSGNISGLINDLEINLVSKKEFFDEVLPTLQGERLNFAQSAEWIDPQWDSDIAAFINGNKMSIYSYDLGRPDFKNSPYYIPPVELSSRTPDTPTPDNLYFSIYGNWARAVVLTQMTLIPEDKYWDNVSVAYQLFATQQEIMCPGITRSKRSLVADCKQYINYTFNPNSPVPPTPGP